MRAFHLSLLFSMGLLGAISAYADIDPNALPAPTPPLQYVNTANYQMNNNEPLAPRKPVEAPTPFANQEARLQQNMQVPDVTLPFPITPDPSPAPEVSADPQN